MYHVDSFTAIIVPPQAAILAAGSITDRVVAVDGKPTVRAMMTCTLSCDHRVVDGVGAASFLDDLATAIGDPRSLLE
jgi:pyruvate dehydrogenase E2 component (dihydrolipoamide acetyltransferase)